LLDPQAGFLKLAFYYHARPKIVSLIFHKENYPIPTALLTALLSRCHAEREAVEAFY